MAPLGRPHKTHHWTGGQWTGTSNCNKDTVSRIRLVIHILLKGGVDLQLFYKFPILFINIEGSCQIGKFFNESVYMSIKLDNNSGKDKGSKINCYHQMLKWF